jgi:hypothetical protein
VEPAQLLVLQEGTLKLEDVEVWSVPAAARPRRPEFMVFKEQGTGRTGIGIRLSPYLLGQVPGAQPQASATVLGNRLGHDPVLRRLRSLAWKLLGRDVLAKTDEGSSMPGYCSMPGYW